MNPLCRVHATPHPHMLFQQVILSSLAFSAPRNCSVQSYPPGVFRLDITPCRGATEITVEQNPLLADAWDVRIETQFTRRYGLGAIRFPPVMNEAALERTLLRAWAIEQHRMHTLNKCFTRLREKEASDISSSGSASPPPLRTGGSPRSPPRPG